jgi:lysophospholipase L1-like esterase
VNTYIVLGDSQAGGLLQHLQEQMRTRGFTPIGAAVHDGWSTSRFVEEQPAVALGRLRPNVAIIVLGGNDVASTAMARAGLGGDIGRLVQQLRGGEAQPHIIWIGPAHSTEPGVQRRHEATADFQRAIMPTLGVEWHDSEPMTSDLGHAPDGVHFTQVSYARWAARINAVLFTNDRASRGVGVAIALATLVGVGGLAWLWWHRG